MSRGERPAAAHRRPPLAAPRAKAAAQWIDDDAALAAACQRWSGADTLAVDTEFVRERTFFPALGLVQIGVGDPEAPEIALVDTPAIADRQPLVSLLTDPRVLKILHAAGEDMGVFQHGLGVMPSPIFDTQLGAALAGYPFGLGYSHLVEAIFAVSLPKESQRTNWLRRPLSEQQLSYAARDVLYLPAIHRHLHQRLDAEGRVGWVLEDSAQLADSDRLLPDPDSVWRKIKGTGRVGTAGQGSLEALAAWRELAARRRDLPRGFVLRDETLVALAAQRPTSAEELAAIEALSLKERKRDGAAILRVLRTAPRVGTPRPPRPSHDPRPLVKELKSLLTERARALDVAVEALASRKHLEAILRRLDEGADEPLPSALRGWRRRIVGEPLVARARQLLTGRGRR